MLSVVHHLGELEHIYDKHNIKLRTDSCITFSSIQSSDHPFSSGLHDLDALTSSGTWIDGVNRLLLHIELLFDDISVSGSGMSQIAENIGVVLCNAKLWSQLGLDASLSIIDSNKLYISLSKQSLSNADIRPPSWFPNACIESIGMSFHFSTCRRTRDVLGAQCIFSKLGTQHTLTSPGSTVGHLDRHYHSSFSSLRSAKDTLTDSCAPLTFLNSLVATSPLSSHDSALSNAHSTSALSAPAMCQRYAIKEVKFEILVQMIDSSLRRIISDIKPVRPGGIVLSSDAGCPKLAGLSPALFSPGYVKAVSQRATLLPTIARSVSRVCTRTKSKGLTHRLERIQQLSTINSFGHDSNVDSDSDSVMLSPCHAEAPLWFLTRSKLIDPLACRGLKSLSTSHRGDCGSHEMLDESLEDVEDAMLDENEAQIFDAYDTVDLFQEHSLDEMAGGENDPLEDDLIGEHASDEVAYDGMVDLDYDPTTFCTW